MQTFNRKDYEDDIVTILRYLKKIFDSQKCAVEGHKSAPTSFCFAENCEKRLMCPECLVKDNKHVAEHQATTITVTQYLEQLLVTNMDSFTINQYKIQELQDFYETMWKGLQICFRVGFDYRRSPT